MCQTVHREYKGWSITIRCSHRKLVVDKSKPSTYEAMAQAELLPGQNPADWVDPRMQVMNTGGRSFECPEECVESLLADAKELIDALHK